ncbi:MAG TPA: helix-turn-helix domain-containing protein [Kineosporiaceae bacterium]
MAQVPLADPMAARGVGPTPEPAPPPLGSVAVLVHPGVATFEFGTACEVFGTDRSAEGLPLFDVRICTERPGLVASQHGFELTVRHGLEALAGADLVIVIPAGVTTAPSPAVAGALRQAVAGGARVTSMCSASFILARAGLLAGRRATTHWRYAEAFRAEFPDVDLVPDVLYVEDGPIATSAGTAAGIDLCLHLVRRSHGPAVAGAIARRMVVPPHRDGGQAQFVRTPVAAAGADALAPVLEWVAAHLGEDLSVARLAARAAMSERTFARRFRDETGTTPHHWVTAQRVALAEQLLEEGVLGMEEVARRCGFASADMLRHHFVRMRSTTPTAYRRTFGCA